MSNLDKARRLKAFTENPPEKHAALVAIYLQAINRRVQAEGEVRKAEQALRAVQDQYQRHVGYETALCDLLMVALDEPTGEGS